LRGKTQISSKDCTPCTVFHKQGAGREKQGAYQGGSQKRQRIDLSNTHIKGQEGKIRLLKKGDQKVNLERKQPRSFAGFL